MRMRHTRKLGWAALLGSLALAPLALSAQPAGHRGFRGDRGGRFGHPGAIFRELDLTQEQREQMRALREDETSRDAMNRLMERRSALHEAVESGADEATIRQLAYEVGMAEGDVAVERARIHAQMMAILTPEQQEKYRTLREEQQQEREERRQRFRERMEKRRNRNPDSF